MPFPVLLKQKNASSGSVLQSGDVTNFGWEFIDTSDHVLNVVMPNKRCVEVTFDAHGVLQRLSVSSNGRNHMVQLEVMPDGPTRVLRMTRAVGKAVRTPSVGDFYIVDEEEQARAPVSLTLELTAPVLGISGRSFSISFFFFLPSAL